MTLLPSDASSCHNVEHCDYEASVRGKGRHSMKSVVHNLQEVEHLSDERPDPKQEHKAERPPIHDKAGLMRRRVVIESLSCMLWRALLRATAHEVLARRKRH